RRFAGAVFTQNGVDFAAAHRQIDIVVGLQITVALGNALELKQRLLLVRFGRALAGRHINLPQAAGGYNILSSWLLLLSPTAISVPRLGSPGAAVLLATSSWATTGKNSSFFSKSAEKNINPPGHRIIYILCRETKYLL